MANESTPRTNPYADIAPALGEYTDQVLFGDVWERTGLSKRDRSLILLPLSRCIAPTNCRFISNGRLRMALLRTS